MDRKKTFQNLISNNTLAHSYLFFGEDKNALLEFADWLAAYLEKRTPFIDTMNTGGGIGDIREGIKFLWQKPVRSPRKILIIPAAENLTIEAQNAILKTAEAPPEHALIMLLIKNPDVLLPTLRSRFQKIYFGGRQPEVDDQQQKLAEEFLKASISGRKEIIKEVVEDNEKLKNFVEGLIIRLRRDKIKNWKAIKELLGRWALINQFNTNKKLQLEAWTKHLL